MCFKIKTNIRYTVKSNLCFLMEKNKWIYIQILTQLCISVIQGELDPYFHEYE